MILLAIDPGQNGAAVLAESRGDEVAVLDWAELYGSTEDLYIDRLVTWIDGLGTKPDLVLIERPPAKTRRYTPNTRHTAMFGLGLYAGFPYVVARLRGWPVRLLPVSNWTRQLKPLVESSKRGDGEHRILEAVGLINGFERIVLAEVPKSDKQRDRQIAAAEAALMCLAVAIEGGLSVLKRTGRR